ncbi:MAG: 5'-methylthioadenosine/adenosylhomocysteine nucleosidase [Gammaproteobacteria bacterium]|nr:5'-methylthioadenosine/adenosylhomocysteine nucleosidase [Gammaproteobacteria bacterium]
MNKQTIGIIGAMPQEVQTLIQSVNDAQSIEIAGLTLVSGTINNVDVVIMQSGIGKVNATIATTIMIEKYKPSIIINTGSAGGLGNSLRVGDIVIGENVTHHDVDVTAFGYTPGQMAGMPEHYPCDSHLATVAQKCTNVFKDAHIHHGQIVSGDQFIADNSRFSEITTKFPQALAVEMEAAAIAQTCYRFNVPFIVIRAISDLANEKASISFDEFIEHAGKQSATMVINMIGELA